MTLASQLQSPADQVRALNLKGVGKRFPGVVALDGVDLEVWRGEVHGLVGENGAGKSTLIKMVTGAEHPDTGRIDVFGTDALAQDIHHRRLAGVSAIYQELAIVPHLSAAANVFLHDPPQRRLLVDRKAMRRSFQQLADRLGVAISPDALASELSIADRQMIEIMRALATKCRLLIMDEPTATLGPTERSKLYDVIRDLSVQGVAILYVSHDLDEVLDLSSRISVMRGGRLVETAERGAWTKQRMVAAMIGHKPLPISRRTSVGTSHEILAVRDLVVPGRIDGINLTLNKGEVLGIAGLVGAGRTEILAALAGADSSASGWLTYDGKSGALPTSVRAAVQAGIVLVPEDRKRLGFVPLMAGWENVALTAMGRIARGGVVSKHNGTALAASSTSHLGFKSERLAQPVGTLSGGNQQKLVIGKWLHRRPRVLLLDEPTRGVDIGAKAEIYASVSRLADEGLSVILVSSELAEIVEQSDRVLVLARRRIVAELGSEEATVKRILSLIFSVEGTQ
jgi:ABC-type sugar transport system ATPase subunit